VNSLLCKYGCAFIGECDNSCKKESEFLIRITTKPTINDIDNLAYIANKAMQQDLQQIGEEGMNEVLPAHVEFILKALNEIER